MELVLAEMRQRRRSPLRRRNTLLVYTGSWCADGLTTSWNGSWRGSAPDGAVSWDGEIGVTAQARDADPVAIPLSLVTKDWMPRSPSSSLHSTAARPRPARSTGTCGAWRWSGSPLQSSRLGATVAFADVFAAAHKAALAVADADVAAGTVGVR